MTNIPNVTYANCRLTSNDFKLLIDNPDRRILIEPFDTFETQCGETLDTGQSYELILQEYSDKVEEHFEYSNFMELSLYEYIFQEVIHVSGMICSVSLTSKTNNQIIHTLNFLVCKLCKISSTGLDDICNMDYHIMPILLIPSNSIINKLGLYSEYINAGAYICKLFDYHLQCTSDEIKRKLCYLAYTYIGKRYLRVW